MTTDLEDRLRTQAQKIAYEGYHRWSELCVEVADVLGSQADRIQALEAKCALLEASLGQAEKAEARYEWLRRRVVMWDAPQEASFTLTLFNDEGPTGEFLDEVIDTAIAAQAGSKEG